MLRKHASLISNLQTILDLILAVLAFISALYIKRNLLPESIRGLAIGPNYSLVALLIIIIWYIANKGYNVHGSHREKELVRVLWINLLSVFTGMLFLLTLMYILKIRDVSRLLLGIFFLIDLGLLFSINTVVYVLLRRFRRRGYNYRTLLILGTSAAAKEVIVAVEKLKWTGFKIVGCLDRSREDIGKKVYNNIKIIGTYDHIEEILVKEVIDVLVFADDLEKIPRVNKYIEIADEMGILVYIIPQWKIVELGINTKIGRLKYDFYLGIPSLSIVNTPENRAEIVFKTIGDYLIASIGLLLSFPAWLVISFCIKLISPHGPVFFKQERIGQNGRVFMLYKFRTMVPNAEEQIDMLRCINECDGPVFKIKNDPRIIPFIGTLLRKTGLDELPQLINVMKGELSIVGPRPPLTSEVKCYKNRERRRLSMKPGITCLWQVQPNRNDICFDDWVKMDLFYIDNWSLWVDAKIIYRTVWSLITGSGR